MNMLKEIYRTKILSMLKNHIYRTALTSYFEVSPPESDRSIVTLEMEPDPDRMDIAWKSRARREIPDATS
jgi:hypothetical protein